MSGFDGAICSNLVALTLMWIGVQHLTVWMMFTQLLRLKNKKHHLNTNHGLQGIATLVGGGLILAKFLLLDESIVLNGTSFEFRLKLFFHFIMSKRFCMS